MKKTILIAITSVTLFACNQQNKADVNFSKFNKNIVVAKEFVEAFSTKDSIKEASLLSQDFIAFGPRIGQDSISKDILLKGDREAMITYSDIKLTNADYYPGVDSKCIINPEVRVYGTWIFKFAKSGKLSKMKWYAEFKINDAGKIYGFKEYCELEDMKKNYN